MSKVGKGVKKVFKTAAPVIGIAALGVAGAGALGAFAGPTYTFGSVSATGAITTAGATSALSSIPVTLGQGAISAAISKAVGGAVGGGVGGAKFDWLSDTPPSLSPGGLIDMGQSGTGGGGIFDWMNKNPEGTKLLGGLISGAATGWMEGKKMKEQKRQFEESRKWPGAFYGTERSAGVIPSRQRNKYF